MERGITGAPAGWWVEIIEDATGKTVKASGPHPERKANKIADGMSINLDHDNYTVSVSQLEQA